MSDLATFVGAGVSALTPMGGALAWFVQRFEKRIKLAEAKVAECEGHRKADEGIISRLIFEVRRDGIAIRMLCGELSTVSPGNVTLANVAAVLRQAYSPELAVPQDWSDLLAEIEHGSAHAPAIAEMHEAPPARGRQQEAPPARGGRGFKSRNRQAGGQAAGSIPHNAPKREPFP